MADVQDTRLTNLAETMSRLNTFDGILSVWLECSGVTPTVLPSIRLEALKEEAKANLGTCYSDHIWGVYGALRVIYSDHPKVHTIASSGVMLYAVGNRIRGSEMDSIQVSGLTPSEVKDILNHLSRTSYRIKDLQDMLAPVPDGYLLN